MKDICNPSVTLLIHGLFQLDHIKGAWYFSLLKLFPRAYTLCSKSSGELKHFMVLDHHSMFETC